MKLYNKLAYHSTSQKGLKEFKPMTDSEVAFKGEGAMVHGYGLYLQEDKELNIERYKSRYDETINNEVNEYGYSLNALVVDGKEYNRNGYGNKNPWDITVKTSNGNWEDIPSSDFCDTLNDIMDDCWSFDITDASELENGYPDFFKEHDVEVIADKVDPEENVIHKGSQYTVEIPDDMMFLDEDNFIYNTPIKDLVNEIVTELVSHMDELTIEELTNHAIGNGASWIREGLTPEEQKRRFIIEFGSGSTGKYWYKHLLPRLLNVHSVDGVTDADVSKFLSEHGIDGIKYYGNSDGDCYVIFNCSKLKIIKEE